MRRLGSTKAQHRSHRNNAQLRRDLLIRHGLDSIARGDCELAYGTLLQVANEQGVMDAEERGMNSRQKPDLAANALYGKFQRECLVGRGGLGDEDPPEYDEPQNPEEGDITTEDHHRWWMDGKLYFTGSPKELAAKLNREGWYPNVWFISDHGNAHLISRLED